MKMKVYKRKKIALYTCCLPHNVYCMSDTTYLYGWLEWWILHHSFLRDTVWVIIHTYTTYHVATFREYETQASSKSSLIHRKVVITKACRLTCHYPHCTIFLGIVWLHISLRHYVTYNVTCYKLNLFTVLEPWFLSQISKVWAFW